MNQAVLVMLTVDDDNWSAVKVIEHAIAHLTTVRGELGRVPTL